MARSKTRLEAEARVAGRIESPVGAASGGPGTSGILYAMWSDGSMCDPDKGHEGADPPPRRVAQKLSLAKPALISRPLRSTTRPVAHLDLGWEAARKEPAAGCS